MSSSKDFAKLIREASYRYNTYDVFRDFCELSAIAISNAVDWPQRDEREATYMKTIGKYEPKEVALFPQMLGCVVNELEAGHDDVLGRIYMELEISNKHTGQFFTPYSLCQVIAAMQIDDTLKAKIEQQGFVTVNEPACGGGAMVIAFADEFRKAGLNPQTQMHVTAQDLDSRAAHMTYIQLSLLGIPAIVRVGNTITMEVSSEWYTPAHIMGGWKYKLRAQRRGEVAEPVTPAAVPVAPALLFGQMGLFGEAA